MNTMGALMNRVQPIVAIQPLQRVVSGVPRPPEHLDRVFVGLETKFRRPGFGNRGEKAQQQFEVAVGAPTHL